MQEKVSKIAIIDIINRLKIYFQVDTDTALADMIGVKQNTLSSWKKRNAIDFELIITKCDNINLNWLFFGTGDMQYQNSVPPAPDPDKEKIYKELFNERNSEVTRLNREIGSLHKELEIFKKHSEARGISIAADPELRFGECDKT